MAEQEVVKHSRKVYKIWKAPGTLKHKIGEFSIEIIVIVFAISLTLFLERWRENQHDRHLEKEFLVDLRTDIIDKMRELEGDNKTFTDLTGKLKYLYKTGRQEIPYNSDSIQPYMRQSLSAYFLLTSNNVIFESLKSSGKITVITNKKLRTDIINLYQLDLPTLQTVMSEFYYPAINKLKDFVLKNKIRKNNVDNLAELLMTQPEFSNLLENMEDGYRKVAGGYRDIIKTNHQLLAHIDEELK